MHPHPINPFVYGKPVPPSRFIGRRDVLRTVFSRLHHGDSTALLGLPHFGKSSVLRYLDSAAVRRAWLGSAADALQVVQVDCHALPACAQPADFWRPLVDAALAAWGDDAAVRQAAAAAQASGYAPLPMTRLFGQALGQDGRRVALLLDEVEVLLHHPSFCRAEFLGMLRSLATRTDGLVLLLASAVSLTQMNRLSAEANRGSPFFNNCIEVPLAPLSADEIRLLLDTSLGEQAGLFQPEDHAFVVAQSGGQPYLVQATAAALFERVAEGVPAGPERYAHAASALHQQVGSYFDALWQHLAGPLRRTLVLCVLAQQGAAAQAFAQPELARCAAELQRLRQLGLVFSPQPVIAAALAQWTLGQAQRLASPTIRDRWAGFLGVDPETRSESELLRAQVLAAAADVQHSFASLTPVEYPAESGSLGGSRPAPLPTLRSLRLLLQELLASAAELDRFCLDYFRNQVFARFTHGMDRVTRLNLLLEAIPAEEILARLAADFPQALAERRHLLQYDQTPGGLRKVG